MSMLSKKLVVSCALLAALPSKMQAVVTFKDIQKIKTCLEVPLWTTGLTGIFALDPLKCGIKYEKVLGSNVLGAQSGFTKWKTELTVNDTWIAARWMLQLARLGLVDTALETNTWAGEKLAMVSAYVLGNKAIRTKISELTVLKKQQPKTLAQKREQISKILALKAEITSLLEC